MLIPEEFFVTGGKAVSSVSKLNAFDLALKDAGIEHCNIVKVSSILPPNCREVDRKPLPIGAITYAVLARMDGSSGSTISAGIAWAHEENNSYGIVAEAKGYMDEKTMRGVLKSRIEEMARARGIKIGKIKYRIETMKVPPEKYGCAVVALVYL
ncbi:MAG: hypothetical protein AYL31_010990 [Candidatus Bathyarchaeota archaeon B26-1]|nr:MAG: hypothetical protein AYL31_010990 [Candidatus Bathyarchaeota archaeon B26-1]